MEGYASRWGTIINPTRKQLEELSAATERAVAILRADQHFCTAGRLEDAVAVVTGDSIPLSRLVEPG